MTTDLLLGTPEAGDDDGIETQASHLRARGAALREQATLAGSAGATLADLDGRAVTVQAELLGRTATRLEHLAGGADEAAQILDAYAAEVRTIAEAARGLRASVAEHADLAENHRVALEWAVPEVSIAAHTWPEHAAAAPRIALRPEYVLWTLSLTTIHGLRVDWQDLVERRAELDATTVTRLQQIEVLAEIDQAVPGVDGTRNAALAAALWAGGQRVTADLLASAGSARAVRAAWDRLTPAQRAALVRTAPQIIGNLDGVPLKYRAQANRARIRAEIAALEEQIATLDAEILQLREDLVGRLDASELSHVMERRDELANLLGTYEGYLTVPAGREVFGLDKSRVRATEREVIVFDPPAVAIYHGPYDEHGDIPAWVGNVAVHVPGTGTTLDSFPKTDGRVYDLYRRANQVGERPTAMIGWAGGDFPQGAEAASDSFTRDLAPKFRDFVAAIDTHPETSALTVTGHSYGGAVVGKAEHVGLDADRVLYVAAAGMGNDVDGTSDFPRTADVPHYALMARIDGVVGAFQGLDVAGLGHGASPLLEPDVIRLETGWIDASDPSKGLVEQEGPFDAHSAVYTPGSTAFENMVAVITGGDATVFNPLLFLDDEREVPISVPVK